MRRFFIPTSSDSTTTVGSEDDRRPVVSRLGAMSPVPRPLRAEPDEPLVTLPTQRGQTHLCCADPPCSAGADGVAMAGEWANDDLSSGDEIDPAADLRELEDEIARLSGIHAVRVVGDRS